VVQNFWTDTDFLYDEIADSRIPGMYLETMFGEKQRFQIGWN
jgi:hypothetical protein